MSISQNVGPLISRDQIEQCLRRFFTQWYRQHGRSFPWREPGVPPFGILLAELLLRQTRAEMVAQVWPVFTNEHPDPESCLAASDAELYDLLSPLGLGRQRVEAVQQVSDEILAKHGGKVPQSIGKLVQLPHIGLYAAHAIACFAFNRRVPIVDGNVLRVFSRLTGEDFGRDNRRGRAPEAWELAHRVLPQRHVKEHNYGLLDFSAQVCTARNPRHVVCPLAGWCAFERSVRYEEVGGWGP